MEQKSLSILLVVILVGLHVVPPAEAGIKKFFEDTVAKVKSGVKRIFNCDSHETDDDHQNAITKDGAVNTLEGIGKSEGDSSITTITTTPITTPSVPPEPSPVPTAIDVPQIDLRSKEDEIGPRTIIGVPVKTCPPGQLKGHDGNCYDKV